MKNNNLYVYTKIVLYFTLRFFFIAITIYASIFSSVSLYIALDDYSHNVKSILGIIVGIITYCAITVIYLYFDKFFRKILL